MILDIDIARHCLSFWLSFRARAHLSSLTDGEKFFTREVGYIKSEGQCESGSGGNLMAGLLQQKRNTTHGKNAEIGEFSQFGARVPLF